MSAIAEKTIRAEQMLHGYSGGHRLLSSSCSLSRSGERHARMMSDLTGASFKPGFDGYLTGYPLEEDELFAIAKTWFAKEQPRPGCVWTHTVLIKFKDLARFEAFGELLGFFRQPSRDNYKGYGEPVALPFMGESVKPLEPLDYTAHVLEAIYSHPDDIIALPSTSAKDHEALVLAMWRQQWASLRTHFSFCTGALELRVGESRIDVQVIPAEKRLVEKASQKAKIVGMNEGQRSGVVDAWISVATKDLFKECDGSFNAFLGSYVDTEHNSRADFRRYSMCFTAMKNTKEFSHFITTVTKEFPTKSEAKKLKAAIAGPKKERALFKTTKDAVILRAILLRNETLRAFDLASLGVCHRFSELWVRQEEEAWSLLTDVADSNLVESMKYLMNAVSPVVSKDSIVRMAADRCDLAAEVVKRNPSLAVVSEIWRCRELTFSSLCEEFIEQATSNTDFAKSVVAAWAVADRQDCARALADAIGPGIVPFLLSLEPTTLSLMDRQGGEWHAVLRASSAECLKWLRTCKAASAEAACLATLGIPIKGRFNVAVLEAWLKANVRKPSLGRQTLHHAYATMLAVAFDNSHQQVAESITCVCFPTVYEAAMNNELSECNWETLQRRLPESGLWWDRCKTLRMGLLHYCVKANWSAETFIRCTSVGFAYEQVLASWGLAGAEKAFLTNSITHALARGSNATPDQKKAAERYKFWF